MPGQAYVALSRLRSLEGLILLSPLRMNGIASDREVVDYSATRSEPETLEKTLRDESMRFVHDFLSKSFEFHSLLSAWQQHLTTYEAEQKSPKSVFKPWAVAQLRIIEELPKSAQIFVRELNQAFADPKLDHIAKRVRAATDYFFPYIDQIAVGILRTIENAKRRKKMKAFLEELSELYELQSSLAIHLLRAVKLIETVRDGIEISKQTMSDQTIANYRSRQIELVKSEFLTVGPEEQDFDDTIAESKPKKKKSTYLETYELWQQKLSVAEIAKLRKLTNQTIYNHLAKLISIKAISLQDVLSDAKINALAEVFDGYEEDSLSPLKEKVGTRFTWDELRIFKASLANTQPEPQE